MCCNQLSVYCRPPFSDVDVMKVYNMIIRGIDAFEFSRKVSRTAQTLIKRLCRPAPADRLGYSKRGVTDIRANKYVIAIT